MYVIHYIDFVAELGGISSTHLNDLITGNNCYKLRASKKELDLIVRYISKKDIPDKFAPNGARLFIKIGNEEIFVASNGRVKSSLGEYLLNPQYFLRLRDYLEMIKVKNGLKDYVPKYY